MSTSTSPLLVRVDPRAVAVDPSLLQPTAWDRKVVLDDLRQYVSRTRLVNATPRLRLRDGRLFVVSGLPFLTAARDAVPALSEVVCEIAGKLHEVQQANLQVVSVSSLLDAMPPIYRSTQMLFFRRPLNAEEQLSHSTGTMLAGRASAPSVGAGSPLRGVCPSRLDLGCLPSFLRQVRTDGEWLSHTSLQDVVVKVFKR
jgi:hypothetical protein